MKILFLAARYHPEIGGVEKHVFEISKRLVKEGNEVCVLTEQTPKNQHSKSLGYQSIGKSDRHGVEIKKPVKSIQNEFFVANKITIFRLKFGKSGWFKKFKIWLRIAQHLHIFFKADIIHCHDVFFWILPFRFLFPRKKIFTTFHGYESFPVRKKSIVIRKISELLSGRTICVGRFMKKWYNASPDYIIYGGVDVERLKKVRRKVKKPSALFIGRLDEQTGILEYCKTIEEIKRHIPEFSLTIAGDGLLRKQALRYGRVLGFIPNPEFRLKNYKYAFVSRYLAILEALASRRMVFAIFDNQIKEDYLMQTPFSKFISISDSSESCVREVLYYIDHPEEERKKIEAGYAWVQSQTWDNVVGTYKKLWKK